MSISVTPSPLQSLLAERWPGDSQRYRQRRRRQVSSQRVGVCRPK